MTGLIGGGGTGAGLVPVWGGTLKIFKLYTFNYPKCK